MSEDRAVTRSDDTAEKAHSRHPRTTQEQQGQEQQRQGQEQQRQGQEQQGRGQEQQGDKNE